MDQDEAFRRVWQAFRTSDHVEDGRQDTEAWGSHAGPFCMVTVRVPAALLSPELAKVREAMAQFPFIRVHPDGFLHITIQELGFLTDTPSAADEVSPVRLEEFAHAASHATAERSPFTVSLGGVNSFQDAVFLEVHDGGALQRLHARLFELAAIPRAPRYAYLPHSTIGHYTADAPSAHLAATLSPWRLTVFGQFPVDQVEIVTLRTDEPSPPLETYAILPLGR